MSTEGQTPRRSAREQLREFRRVVADAVGELRSAEIRNTYSALSLEELMDKHIQSLTGNDDPMRPSRLSRLNKVKDDLSNSIEAMKEVPPDLFRRQDTDGDVNTPPEGI